MELNKVGYAFCTLLDYYVVHINHPISRKDLKGRSMRRMNKPHFKEFQKYLKDKKVNGSAWETLANVGNKTS
jgi:hypothetical protein